MRFSSDMFIRTLYINQLDIKNLRLLITVLIKKLASFRLFPEIETMAPLSLFFNQSASQHFFNLGLYCEIGYFRTNTLVNFRPLGSAIFFQVAQNQFPQAMSLNRLKRCMPLE